MAEPTWGQRAGIAAAVTAIAGTLLVWRVTTGGPPPPPLYVRDGGYVAIGWPDGGAAPPGTVCLRVEGKASTAALELFYSDAGYRAQPVLTIVCDPPLEDAGSVATPSGMDALTGMTGRTLEYAPGTPRMQVWVDAEAPYDCACQSGEYRDGGPSCTVRAPDGGRQEAYLGLVLKPADDWQGAGCRRKACAVYEQEPWPVQRCPLE